MANENLEGVTVAIFVTDGFEQIKLTEPKMAFDEGRGDTRRIAQERPGPLIEVHSQKFRGAFDI